MDELLSSPQPRARATAEEVAAAQRAAGGTAPAVQVSDALRNRDWGALAGRPAAQARQPLLPIGCAPSMSAVLSQACAWPPECRRMTPAIVMCARSRASSAHANMEVACLRALPNTPPLPPPTQVASEAEGAAEPLAQFWERAGGVWHSAATAAHAPGGRTIALVAHSAIVSAMLCRCLGLGPERLSLFRSAPGRSAPPLSTACARTRLLKHAQARRALALACLSSGLRPFTLGCALSRMHRLPAASLEPSVAGGRGSVTVIEFPDVAAAAGAAGIDAPEAAALSAGVVRCANYTAHLGARLLGGHACPAPPAPRRLLCTGPAPRRACIPTGPAPRRLLCTPWWCIVYASACLLSLRRGSSEAERETGMTLPGDPFCALCRRQPSCRRSLSGPCGSQSCLVTCSGQRVGPLNTLTDGCWAGQWAVPITGADADYAVCGLDGCF